MRNRHIIKLSSLSEKPTIIDARWVSLPIISFLAYIIGDVSLWVIILVLVGAFEANIRI